MGDNNNDPLSNTKVPLLIVGIGSAAFIITVYHYIIIGWCKRQRSNPIPPSPGHHFAADAAGTQRSSIELSTTLLIPAHKYQKGAGLVNEEGTCAICLCEFEEGEELRTLPECSHSYHAPCIDMWFYSHSNCPICRTDAVGVSPEILRPMPLPPLRPEFGSHSLRANSALQLSFTIV